MAYDSVGLLGRGGSALVELAHDAEGRPVATKRVAVTGSAEDMRIARARLRREAAILARLHHPGIVAVLDVVDDGADVVVVLPVMAENLADRVRRVGPLPPAELARVGHRLIGALAAAHRCGVVHRDIKPANVLFDADGRPALSDFGIAFSSDVTAGLTAAGTVVGSPAWMAPEQAQGWPATAASDVWALAATLAYAAGGGVPAPDRRVDLDPVPPSLRPALARMLDPDPAARPSAAELLGGPDGTVVVPAGGPGAAAGVSGLAGAAAGVAGAAAGLGGAGAAGGLGGAGAAGGLGGAGSARAAGGPGGAVGVAGVAGAGDTAGGLRGPAGGLRAAGGARAAGAGDAAGGLGGAGGPGPAVGPRGGLGVTGRLGAAGSARAAGSGDGDTAGGLWRLGPGPGSGGRRRPGGLRGRAVLAGAVGAALVAVAVLGVLVATAPTPAAGTHRAVACVALPYQPCGAPPAPHTDGAACDPGWYDLDGSAADGCEARSDYTAGTVLTTGVPVRANLVPVTMADTFTTHVAGDALALCWGSLHVTLTAPPGTAEELTVRHGGTVVGRALSAGGTPATATVSKPSCLSGDSEDLTLVVRSVAASGPATAADFTLTRDGGW